MPMQIINARLRQRPELYRLEIENGTFTAITAQDAPQTASAGQIDAGAKLVCAPFIEPHIHLDAALTAGEPSWNQSGTLFEGIERWGERKPMLTEADIRERALKTLNLLIGNGVQFVRTHADTSDPSLIGLKTLCTLRDELKDKIDIQVVAFPQDGLLSYPGGEKLMEEALEFGAEIDDPNSRFLEVLACEALFNDLGSRVTASHTTAMHSYDNAYCSKLFLLLKRSGINFVSCPTESIHLQGRFDTYPKRRGVTRVKELNEAGINVCFAEDSIFDPWYSLGNGKLLRTLDFGLHICQMMGYQDFSQALSLITDNSARTLNIEERYGIEVGKPASFNLLEGEDDYSVLRNQGEVLLSVRHGEIIMQREPAKITTPPWLGF